MRGGGVQWGLLHEIKIIIRVCLHAGACILYTHPPREYARDLETQQEGSRTDGRCTVGLILVTFLGQQT